MDTNNELRCIGCGAVIQTDNPKEAGYTPKSAYEKGVKTNQLYCQRCFRLRHYSQIEPVNISDDQFLKLLNQIQDTNALIVYVVDIFNFNGSIIPGIQRFVGKNPFLLVGNKADLIPRSINRSKIKDWLRQRSNEIGIKPLGIQLISAKTNQYVDQLFKTIDQLRGHRDVYIVGVTNVGKSTLMNQLIRQNTGIRELITTSRFPGTTLDQIKIDLNDGHQLVDTPGIVHHSEMAHYLNGKDLKIATPQKPIKPREYQLNSGQTLFLGGLARFDYVNGHFKKGFTIYVNNDLLIHRTKLANADDVYKRQFGKLLTPPSEEYQDSFPKLVRYEFKTSYKSDLVFEGLGWITVPSNVVIAGWAPKGMDVLIRRSMI
ncbi:ribosome biogenesis GTPase YqeH [Philodulcilactobacillus myokoensis]|uniref:Ribosome biogenesis GTPase YqeH n=1 Tax=Philodulcilactobacillus myokoensis TaxID=2929573 RepID=A0A9W6B0L7_9LACO|nr:ribosome biogenesis GTPase YqeH [Philodulcilactobacillus myokoensis]GLB46757.1 ribosome biogenesis GTPase YqeH [Philodulcilactobacillus myokoensis]